MFFSNRKETKLFRSKRYGIITKNWEMQTLIDEHYKLTYTTKSREDGCLSRILPPAKPNPRGSRELKPTNHSLEIESVIKNLPKNKSPGLNSFTHRLYKTFKEELTLTLLNPPAN